MNLDFTAEPLFSWYVVLLAVSGLAMVVLAIVAAGQSGGMRALNGLFGAAFLGYAVYLGFIFEGGEYRMFFQAFILPVLLIVKFVKGLSERGTQAPAQPVHPAPDATS
ncbi:hypothetical protein AB0K43_29835 [Kitasatospora sp. NPDC049258]|uniref:hypothetical protein n=1 Tax=Kitasatospora sp. NPDC049258 TaxID=3155394 RepID=UPI0034363D40